MKKDYITDGGMILQKDSYGNVFHEGKKVSESALKEQMKTQGRVYEASKAPQFYEMQRLAYKHKQ